jgi:response regulator of citrate/malate metabolism
MARVLAECDVPGASVAKVAMAHGINANVVHRWRQLAAGIPIVAVNAAAMPNVVSSGLAQGYFHYLVKPHDLVDRTDAIDAAIDVSRRSAH